MTRRTCAGSWQWCLAARRHRSCSRRTRLSVGPWISATRSARSRTPSITSRSARRSDSARRTRPSRTSSSCVVCGAAAPKTPSSAARRSERCAPSRWSSASWPSSTATATPQPPSSPTARPPPHRWTTIRVYQPTTRPGAPLPHAWIDDEDGNRRPIKDLVTPDRFLLIAGEDGHAWCEAAAQLAEESGVPIDAVRIGHLDGDLYDPRCAWLRQREIDSRGAVLVRPDRFVAWRARTDCADPRGVLASALSQVLAREIDVPVAAGV